MKDAKFPTDTTTTLAACRRGDAIMSLYRAAGMDGDDIAAAISDLAILAWREAGESEEGSEVAGGPEEVCEVAAESARRLIEAENYRDLGMMYGYDEEAAR